MLNHAHWTKNSLAKYLRLNRKIKLSPTLKKKSRHYSTNPSYCQEMPQRRNETLNNRVKKFQIIEIENLNNISIIFISLHNVQTTKRHDVIIANSYSTARKTKKNFFRVKLQS